MISASFAIVLPLFFLKWKHHFCTMVHCIAFFSRIPIRESHPNCNFSPLSARAC
uniref:Uncharacterized protein n=1 Tax=Arundo donax TaxID=35708 RepID=A0A0A9GU89_ARUDO